MPIIPGRLTLYLFAFSGLSNSRLIYDSGEITLVYTDGLGDCHHRYNRTTINRFLCDHSKKGSVDLTYIQEKADCTYVFEWKTALACPPYTQVECSLTGSDGQQYDLSELQLTDDNYYYADPLSPTRRYIINVCRSLVHQKGEDALRLPEVQVVRMVPIERP